MKPDDLLLPVPSFQEWLEAAPDRWRMADPDLTPLMDAYCDQFRVQLPVLASGDGLTIPPDAHILDAVARAWLPIEHEEATFRAEAGTVAVVADLPDCDRCDGMAARYETYYTQRRGTRVAASFCVGCQVQTGDPFLGPGRSVLMLLPEEVPEHLREEIVAAAPEQSSMWDREGCPRDEWEAFRRWGFAGPDGQGRLHALTLGVQLQVRRFNADAVQFRVRRPVPHTWFINEGDVEYGPTGLDDLDVRELLISIVRDHVPPGLRGTVRRQLPIDDDERDVRALRFMQDGEYYTRWLRLIDHPVCASADWSTAKAAATQSEDATVVAQLLIRHVESEIRRAAAANPACTQEALSEALRRGDSAVWSAALERADLSQVNLRELITQVLIAGRLDVDMAIRTLVRPDFPEDLVDRAAERIAGEGTDARIYLATRLHEAPPERRDRLQLRLLQNSRRIKSTVTLVRAIVDTGDGPDAGRLSWLQAQKSARIRDHVADFLEHLAPDEHAQLVGDDATPSPPQPQQVAGPADAATPIPPPSDAIVVAARLRRWWLGEVPQNEHFASSDLGDAHAEIMLRRSGNTLELFTPYDFGAGDPLEGDLGRSLVDRLRTLSGDSVRSVAWRYDPAMKPPRRKRSNDLDIYAPGDPALDQHDQVIARLRAAIPADISDAGRALLGRVGLAAASKHRIWLVVDNLADRSSIGTTPSAGWALNVAVRQVQGAEPLYRVLVDPYLMARSERL